MSAFSSFPLNLHLITPIWRPPLDSALAATMECLHFYSYKFPSSPCFSLTALNLVVKNCVFLKARGDLDSRFGEHYSFKDINEHLTERGLPLLKKIVLLSMYKGIQDSSQTYMNTSRSRKEIPSPQMRMEKIPKLW
jgi:hypothetical protein